VFATGPLLIFGHGAWVAGWGYAIGQVIESIGIALGSMMSSYFG
jgi:hypothetical protein